VIAENANEGTDTIATTVSYQLGDNLENLQLSELVGAIDGRGNELSNVIRGNSSNNTLYGYAGNDTINGGAGVDTMYGGTGDDTYVIDDVYNASYGTSTVDAVTENAVEGIDTVNVAALHITSYTLGSNVENLTVLEGSTVVTEIGNALDNVIQGSSKNDNLYGLGGNDTLKGGLGNDTYYYDRGQGYDVIDNYAGQSGHGTDKVVFGSGISSSSVNYARVGDNLIVGINESGETLTIQNWFKGTLYQVNSFQFSDGITLEPVDVNSMINSVNVVMGNDGSDSLTGTEGNDAMYGLSGDDVLNGQGGDDILSGGL
jgi:Ca2+-binding RTX toxin-like protein